MKGKKKKREETTFFQEQYRLLSSPTSHLFRSNWRKQIAFEAVSSTIPDSFVSWKLLFENRFSVKESSFDTNL